MTKKTIIGFRPDPDVEKILRRAKRATGYTFTRLIEDAIRTAYGKGAA